MLKGAGDKKKGRKTDFDVVVEDLEKESKSELLNKIREEEDELQKTEIYRTIKDSEKEKIDQYFLTFEVAVKRTYPYAEEILFLYKILRMVQMMFWYSEKLFKKRFKNVTSECCIGGNGSKHGSCNIMRLDNLYNKCVDKTKNSIMHTKTLEDHRMLFELNSDVYVCLTHTDRIHICFGRYCSSVDHGAMCKIGYVQRTQMIFAVFDSGNRGVVFQKDRSVEKRRGKLKKSKARGEYEQFMYKGVDGKVGPKYRTGKYKKKTKQELLKENRKTYYYSYNWKKLSISEDFILRGLSKVKNDCIIVNELEMFIMGVYEIYDKMIKHCILKCDKIFINQNNEFAFSRKFKKYKGKKRVNSSKPKLLISNKTKKPKRKLRKVTHGSLNYSGSKKLGFDKKKEDSWKNKKKKFYKFLDMLKKTENVNIVTYTHIVKAREHVKSLKGLDPVVAYKHSSRTSFFVDNKDEFWSIPYDEFETSIGNDIYGQYFSFLLEKNIYRNIMLDKDSEITLRCLNNEMLKYSSEEFKSRLHKMVLIIRKLCPGLFRIISMFEEVLKTCKDKYSKLKRYLKYSYKKGYMPSWCDIEKYLSYDYRKYYLDIFISDVTTIQFAEVMFWGYKMCSNHPEAERYPQTELIEDAIYIGVLYAFKKGIRYDSRMLLDPNPILDRENWLFPEQKVAMVDINRKMVGSGDTSVKNMLISKARIEGFYKVSFLHWKQKHSEIYYPNKEELLQIENI